MAQSYYTLQQASEILGISTDELNQMARRKEVRSFQDGSSVKFRTQDIEELKRSRELTSEGDLFFEDGGSDETASIVPFDEGASATDSGGGRLLQQDPLAKGSGESDVRLIFGGDDAGSDSGVRIVPDFNSPDSPGGAATDKPPGDSDIRLIDELTFEDETLPPAKSSSPPELKIAEEPTEEFRPAAESPSLPGSGMSGGFEPIEDDEAPLLDSATTPTASIPSADAGVSPMGEFDFSFDDDAGLKVQPSGEVDLGTFDLSDKTPTLKQEAGDDSDSDFSLSLDDDIGLAQDVTPGAGDSGINLASPDDSGILLKSAADSGIKLASDTDSSDSEFEVSLESDDDIFDSDEAPGFKASDTAPRMAPVKDSDSEELSDSDFELAIDEDVEVEEGESGSEVVALDEEEESEDFDEEFDEESPYGDAGRGEPIVVVPQPAPWGTGWVVTISFTTIVFILVLMMMFEITRNAWSYNQPYTLNATIINWFYDVGKSAGIMP